MTKIMTATEMSDGQIENAVNKLRDAMRKHRSEITSDVAQQVLGVENLGMIMFEPFRKFAEEVSNFIVRTVKVNRARSPQKALDATERAQYTNQKVMDAISIGEGEETKKVVFFKLDLSNRGNFISDEDLEEEYKSRGLKPAGFYSICAVNEADPAFSDEMPNATHWKDPEGKWCYAMFDHFDGEREVDVNRNDDGWRGFWWFAGVRNISS